MVNNLAKMSFEVGEETLASTITQSINKKRKKEKQLMEQHRPPNQHYTKSLKIKAISPHFL